MSDEMLGRRLRAERERRRITLESIATNTKISIGLLRSLERDDVSRWPGGIFRRSFVRGYAEAIGLDPDDVLAEFLEQYPDPHEPPPPSALPAELPRRATPKTVLRLTLDSAREPFSPGHLLEGARSRLAAVTWDAGTTFAVAMTAYIFTANFWAPLGIFMLIYYLGSVLVLGNTPGVCLFAPGRRPRPSPPPDDFEDDVVGDVQANTFERSYMS
jgi:transcriptional regulator with XRE-family HTH domain